MGELKTRKQKIDYFKRLIETAKGLHKENPNDDYDLLIPHYKKQIRKLENGK